ncbi:unnamed protein product [Linum trigynum]|uniref:DUF668 domain-containing protein n=1 Tax=Linum trigynum TaxID=586398 RepID=A0AAV2FJF2_9ROSI
MVVDSWLGNFIRHSRKAVPPEADRAIIGVLAFEVSKLMSKVVNLWRFLGDGETRTLRDDVAGTIGVRMLVSGDGDYLMELALNEILDNFAEVAVSVAELGKKCADPRFSRFDTFVSDPIRNHLEWFGWEYRPKKMERKVKKMERFAGVMVVLAQELDVLAELERSRRRMLGNPKTDPIKLLESQQRVLWHRTEIRNFRAISPWIRSYDYVVRLLVRSLLTILERIKTVCQINRIAFRRKSRNPAGGPALTRSQSMSSIMKHYYAVHPSPGVGSPTRKKFRYRPEQGKIGHLEPSLPPSPPRGCRHRRSRTRLSDVGGLNGCMHNNRDRNQIGSSLRHVSNSPVVAGENEEPEQQASCSSSTVVAEAIYSKLAFLGSKRGQLINPAPTTLGDTGLYLHYANLITVIEKMVSAPHEIESTSRDELYGMLPGSLRSVLRKRLRDHATCRVSSVGYDATVAAAWRQTVARVLEWLLPLAHNMLRWQAVRNFEREHHEEADSKTHVLLVQTLYFADRAKTEAAIVELIVGLDYLYRISKRLEEMRLDRR